MHPNLRVVASAAAIALLAATIVAPLAMSQVQNAQLGNFGTRVKVGDFDYLPLTKRASTAIRVMEWDAGITGDVTDNCIVLMMDNTDGGALRPVVALPAAGTLYTKDIRLSPCQGKAIGTAIADTDIVEQTAAWTERAVEVRYGDANANGKYDRADPLYLTTLTGANHGLATTTATATWTLRLTDTLGKTAGSFVARSDPNFLLYRTSAAGYTSPAGGGPASRTWSLAEREGNGWYFVPASAAGLAAQAAIPVNSLRIGLVGSGNQQAAVVPSTITLPQGILEAGETYKITVKYSNDGTGSGVGLLVTKLDATIVDARLTPVLGPQETGQAIIPVQMPDDGGAVVLAVGESKVRLDVQGPAKAASLAAPATTDLETRIAELERQLAEREARVDAAEADVANGIPGLAPTMAMATLLGLVLLLRRRD